ncbi:MAG: hypothetical protein ACRDSK_13640 [Actinophytocola sp.]|uniref:phage tail tube protein n=1 Tax=Actinophytocola sp. TaxID=1872138 RepID=UPI003D6A2C29
MANSAAVRVAITGSAYVAPVGSTAPTNSTTAVAAAYTDLGFVSEDGVTEAYEDETTDIKAWQNGAIVRSVISGSKATLKFKLIETRGEALELYHKGSTVAVVGASSWKIDVKGAQADPRALVIDVIDGTKHIRIYASNAEVSERGEIQYVGTDAVAYDLTLTVYPDSNDVLLTKFSDDPNWGYS